MKRILAIMLAIALVGCATLAIKQDVPEPGTQQCFESKFSPFKMSPANGWTKVGMDQGIILLKNPTIGELPDYVAINVNPRYRIIQAYSYLEGRDAVLYSMDFQKNCYVKVPFAPGMKARVKALLLKCRDGHEV